MFKASFFELAIAYALSAYVLGGVCIFGCTWHNLPTSLLAFVATIYCLARGMECLAAWLNSKWHHFFAAKQESRTKVENRLAVDLRGQSAPGLSGTHRNPDVSLWAAHPNHPPAQTDNVRRLLSVS